MRKIKNFLFLLFLTIHFTFSGLHIEINDTDSGYQIYSCPAIDPDTNR